MSDPTRSLTLRRDYAAAATRRFRLVSAAIRDGVGKADALGIGESPPSRPVLLQAEDPEVRRVLNALRKQIEEIQIRAGELSDGSPAQVKLLAQATDLARQFLSTPGRFNFPSSAAKVQAMGGWLDQMEGVSVLEIIRDSSGNIASEGGWQRIYVQRAYVKGFSHADIELRKAGVDVNPRYDDVQRTLSLPIHQKSLDLLIARNLSELDGVSKAAGLRIRRDLAEGLARGQHPFEMARTLTDDVSNIGIHRARLIARTEIIRAHAEASLNRYKEFGVDAVKGEVEFATAGDDQVCPICASLDGEVFSLKDAEGVIPVHPNCRCAWLPAVDLSSKVEAALSRNADRVLELRRHAEEQWPAWYRELAA